jgi:FKBP-type peptidyl-prolyl cis-trans isomerase (trigger factor)
MQILIRDNILNAALNIIEKSFKFDINDEDIEKISDRINKSIAEKVENAQPLNDEAIKLNTIFFIKRILIFDEIAKNYNISVSDEELKEILNQYYENTNQPIREIINDDENLKNAKRAFLDEKIIAFILEKFKNTTDLEKL